MDFLDTVNMGTSKMQYKRFKAECDVNILEQVKDEELQKITKEFMSRSFAYKYSYNFEFLGRPIIQYPQDIIKFQEIIWQVKPDLIIETGIAHGGSLILSASLLAMLDYCDATENSSLLDPRKPTRRVLGVDIDIRSHNRSAIEQHPMSSRIEMIEGSSTDPETISHIANFAKNYNSVLVCLDSNHTHEHVLNELEAYAPLVTPGSYCIVFDTIVNELSSELSRDRPWGPDDNPKTAITEFLRKNKQFEIDTDIDAKLLISVAPGGYLKRLKNA